MSDHRHTYVVIRRLRIGGDPFAKQCSQCGKMLREIRGRWVVTQDEWPRREPELSKQKARLQSKEPPEGAAPACP